MPFTHIVLCPEFTPTHPSRPHSDISFTISLNLALQKKLTSPLPGPGLHPQIGHDPGAWRGQTPDNHAGRCLRPGLSFGFRSCKVLGHVSHRPSSRLGEDWCAAVVKEKVRKVGLLLRRLGCGGRNKWALSSVQHLLPRVSAYLFITAVDYGHPQNRPVPSPLCIRGAEPMRSPQANPVWGAHE